MAAETVTVPPLHVLTRRLRLVATAAAATVSATAATVSAAATAVATAGTLAAETIGAVDRLVTARLEGHLRFLAALAANHAKHFALAAAVAAATTAAAVSIRPSSGSAAWTSTRLVCEATFLMICLIISTKDERRAAVGTR
jgi:hypothetical protein